MDVMGTNQAHCVTNKESSVHEHCCPSNSYPATFVALPESNGHDTLATFWSLYKMGGFNHM